MTLLTPNGTLINSPEKSRGFKQLISEVTQILPQSSFCIDLIFTDQPNYVITLCMAIKTVITKSNFAS